MAAELLSLADARRVALAAQGFADRRPAAGTRLDARHVRRGLAATGLLQIDSVNVLVRSHELPLFSRLGPYPRALLPRLAYRERELFEYWAHEASYIPVTLQPHLRWRMARAQKWSGITRIQQEHPEFVAQVLAAVADRGPVTPGELGMGEAGGGPWWGWSQAKTAMEWLFLTGQVTAAGRRTNFERVYDLTERVLPAAVLATPTPDQAEAQRTLLRFSAARLGVGTARDLADYFRIKIPEAKPRLAELVEEGDLVPVQVEGWREPAYLDPTAAQPRRVRARALLSPFDSLLWERSRVERLFGMRLRIELYTPAPKRVHGYYVLPFLLGENLVARVDLKADRRTGRLLALAVHGEDRRDPVAVAEGLAGELTEMARWLGLDDDVAVGDRGDLAGPLDEALRGTG